MGDSTGSSIRRGDGPIASRSATFSSASLDGPPDERARLLRRTGLDDRDVREGGEQRDVADALVRLPGAGGDEPGVVEGVQDLRTLARLVVDLLVRARGEEGCEGVDHGQQSVACHAGRGRDHVLLGDPALDEPVRIRQLERAGAAVRGQVGIEDDEIGMLGPELEQRLAVGVDDVLRRSRRLGFARARAGLGLALETGDGAPRSRPARAWAGRCRARRNARPRAPRVRQPRARTIRRPVRPHASGTCRRLLQARQGAP